jgi:RNA polymerase sigma-70 factor (ECF subfamily)
MSAQSPGPQVELLLAHQSKLRTLALGLLGDRDSADDAVQDAWLLALGRDRCDVRRPRSWLAAILRNVRRQNARAAARRARREQIAAAREALPSTAELVERAELQRRLVEAVLRLEEPYRSTILLRFFESRSVREIAAHRNVPVGTVETHVRRALAKLRDELDQEYGDRSAWNAALLPLAAAPSSTAWLASIATLVGGGLMMATKVKIVAAAVVVIAAGAAWLLVEPRDAGHLPDRGSSVAHQREVGVLPDDASVADRDGPAPVETPQRDAIAPASLVETLPTASEGSLLVRVVWADDQTPAANVMAQLWRTEADPWTNAPRLFTGVDGTARLEHLAPGKATVYLDRDVSAPVEIVAGRETQVALEIPIGVDVEGVVVNTRGEAVAQADIWMGGPEGEFVARSAADGTFRLRALGFGERLHAQARGYAPSLQRLINARAGTTVRCKLVLERAGGEVAGRVLDGNGRPIAGARLRLGEFHREAYRQTEDGTDVSETYFVMTRTDASGAFSFTGFRPGTTELVARARGFAPWRGTVTVSLDVTARVDVPLGMAAIVRGTVSDSEGKPVDGADVAVGLGRDLLNSEARTDAEGRFRLDTLAPGEVEISAEANGVGRASAKLMLAAGAETEWHAVLSSGLEIVGRVLDEHDQPIPGWTVRAWPHPDPRQEYEAFAITDGSGRFVLRNVQDRPHRVGIFTSFRSVDQRDDVRPGPREVLFRVTASQLPTAFFTGTLVDPAGKPVVNAATGAFSSSYGEQSLMTDATGRFRIGPLLPGRYVVWVQAPGFPDLDVDCDHELVANETIEMGDVRLITGGTIVAHVRGEPGEDLAIEVLTLDAAGGVYEPLRLVDGSARTRPIPPGPYLLQVGGPHIAQTSHRVEVVAGRETEVEVELLRGIPTTLRLPYVTGGEITISDALGKPVLVQSIFDAKHFVEPTVLQITPALLPGTYHVAMTSKAGTTAEADITVAEKGDQAFTIEAPLAKER